jgi:hypothetical protein
VTAHGFKVGDIVHVRSKDEPWNHFHGKVSQLVGLHKVGVKRLSYNGFEHFTTWVWDTDITLMTDKPMRDLDYEARTAMYKVKQEAGEIASEAVRRSFDSTPEADRLSLTRTDYLRAASNALLQAVDTGV